MRRSSRLFCVITAIVAPLAWGSCSVRPDAASASSGASSTGGTHEADACGAADAPTGPDTASWDPNADSTYHHVGWDAPAPCVVQLADHPRAAAAPLIWEACVQPADGCQQRATNWPAEYLGYMAMPSIVRWQSGYRVAWEITLNPDFQERDVVYDVDGSPLAVWRTADSHDCKLVPPRLGRERVWLGVQHVDAKTVPLSAYVTEPLDALGTAACAIPLDMPSQGQAASDDVLALWGLNGLTVALYDRKANSWTKLGGAGDGFWLPQPIGGAALARHYAEPEHPQAWIWSGGTGAMHPLIAAGADVVPDVQSDGETLVWVQTAPKSPSAELYPQGDLWTSPFATTPAGLQPTKRRPAPVISGGGNSAAGEGFYAVFSYADQQVHVYRLSDVRHWSFPMQKPPSLMPTFLGVAYVDKDEVWYVTTSGIYRQRLDALGPGDAAP